MNEVRVRECPRCGSDAPQNTDTQCRHYDGKWLIFSKVLNQGVWYGKWGAYSGAEESHISTRVHYFGDSEADALEAFYAAERELLQR